MPFIKLSAVVIDTDTILRFRPYLKEGKHVNTHGLRIVVRDVDGADALDYNYTCKKDRDADFNLLLDALVNSQPKEGE
jgi:hypothetical protein